MTFAQPNRPPTGVSLSPAALSAWVARARPGERLVYHRWPSTDLDMFAMAIGVETVT
jgi:hypothetical protein